MVEHNVAALNIFPFGGRRLGLDHSLNQAVGVFDQLIFSETHLAHRRMYDAGLVDSKLDFTGLNFLMALATSVVTVPVLGLGIKPRGPKHFAELTDRAHHVRAWR